MRSGNSNGLGLDSTPFALRSQRFGWESEEESETESEEEESAAEAGLNRTS